VFARNTLSNGNFYCFCRTAQCILILEIRYFISFKALLSPTLFQVISKAASELGISSFHLALLVW